MLIVNLYGAPGAGKSTGAAYVFSQLKMHGINAELVTEFAKDKVWEESKAVFQNQAYIFGKQYFRISRVQDKVDVVITDSPILLSPFYAHDPILGKEFDRLVMKVSESYDSMNVFINRTKPYNGAGRFQTEAESNALSQELLNFLNQHGVVCRHYTGDMSGYDVLVADILNRLDSKEKVSASKSAKMSEPPVNQTIKIKYLSDEIEKLDYIAGKSDWIDLRAAEDVELKKGEFKLVPLGIAMQLPAGYEAHIIPRSSTYKNFGVIQANHMGMVDESYCGDDDQWYFPAIAMRDTVIHVNDRICQFRIVEHQPRLTFEAVDTLGNANRDGIGSTGTR